jgi:hypothetical protein
MTVKAYYGSAAYDPATQPRVPINAVLTEGHVKCLNSTKELANADSNTSTVNFGKIPSGAVILPQSRFYADGMTSNTAWSLGFTTDAVRTTANVALMSAVDVHLGTAGGYNLSGIDIANTGKAAWELAGYTTDPGGQLDIIGSLGADLTTGSGTVTLNLLFCTP